MRTLSGAEGNSGRKNRSCTSVASGLSLVTHLPDMCPLTLQTSVRYS
jgi:hypothetical protein